MDKITKKTVLCLFFSLYVIAAVSQTYKHPYLNPRLSVEERVDNLLSLMTYEEKMTQLCDDSPAIERLGIPRYVWWNEALHGVARSGYATVFPQSITIANSWDPKLVNEVAGVISDEARAKHHEYVRRNRRGYYQGLTFWSPNINILRDPRWGRGHETYGEDPLLTATLGCAFVNGLQGDHPKYLKTSANAKHYAVHSGPEPLRHVFNAETSDVDLYETYLPAFKALVMDANVESVMGAYNRFRGEACCSSELLMGILRNDWQFKGHVVSDCGAIADFHKHHKTTSNAVESAAAGIKGGTDLNCGRVYNQMPQAAEEGLVTENDIDQALGRLLTTRFKLGMFDPDSLVPYAKIPFSTNTLDNHSYLSRKASRESIVLLKNDKNTLPLDKYKLKTVAVVGPNADNFESLIGNYNGTPKHPVTLLKGMQNKLTPAVEVLYAEGCDLAEGISNLTPVPSFYLETENGQQGLLGEYYNSVDMAGAPVFTRVDDNIDFTWDLVAPDSRLPDDDYAVRWTGYIVPPLTGTYRIGSWADPQYMLKINGQKLMERSAKHAPNHKEYTIEMEAGKRYKVDFAYKNWNGRGQARLLWALPKENNLKKAVEVARKADVVFVVTGLSQRLEGEEMRVKVDGFNGGDRTKLTLPKTQLDLLKALKETGKPVVMVLMSGGAMAINWSDEHLDAILLAGYPGEQGGNAIADVIFGDYNPGGKLPITYYKSVEQLPDFENYDMKNRTYRYFTQEALYPFGYGLSYTSFTYSDLKIPESIQAGDSLHIEVTLSNSGDVSGDEVVQVYLTDKKGSTPRPLHQLIEFERIHLKAGESKVMKFTIAPVKMSMINKNSDRVIEAGDFVLHLGGGQPNVSKNSSNILSKSFRVKGKMTLGLR